jgi:hypothetical protein
MNFLLKYDLRAVSTARNALKRCTAFACGDPVLEHGSRDPLALRVHLVALGVVDLTVDLARVELRIEHIEARLQLVEARLHLFGLDGWRVLERNREGRLVARLRRRRVLGIAIGRLAVVRVGIAGLGVLRVVVGRSLRIGGGFAVRVIVIAPDIVIDGCLSTRARLVFGHLGFDRLDFFLRKPCPFVIGQLHGSPFALLRGLKCLRALGGLRST